MHSARLGLLTPTFVGAFLGTLSRRFRGQAPSDETLPLALVALPGLVVVVEHFRGRAVLA